MAHETHRRWTQKTEKEAHLLFAQYGTLSALATREDPELRTGKMHSR